MRVFTNVEGLELSFEALAISPGPGRLLAA
jgi:hypothetical protein